MTISIIVAADENNVIGKDNDLIWHLPADLKHFKNLTTGHHAIMGRKTYESIGRPLPNRTFIVITRNADYKAEGCIVVNSLEDGIKAVTNDDEAFIIGGAEIYRQALEHTDKIYLTRVHHEFEGDTYFPELRETEWKLAESRRMEPDEKNKYACSFQTYLRKK